MTYSLNLSSFHKKDIEDREEILKEDHNSPVLMMRREM
jgi:hypothetical protein